VDIRQIYANPICVIVGVHMLRVGNIYCCVRKGVWLTNQIGGGHRDAEDGFLLRVM
jgi:hypothetical protein